MKKTIICILFFIMFPQICVAQEKMRGGWTEGDIFREAGWMVLHTMDWGLTLNAADRPKEYTERNPILGDHPSRSKVNIYMGTCLVAHPIIVNYIPREVVWFDTKIPLRALFQSISIGFSGYAVIHNFNAGLHMTF